MDILLATLLTIMVAKWIYALEKEKWGLVGIYSTELYFLIIILKYLLTN